ncbi:MAG TPA: hypothetical protein VL022_10620 [Moheibacter sp.]|nr:hypothetical protein [Moheibacter sp.]
MEKIANKIFSLLGLEVYRKPLFNSIQFGEHQQPIYVELVGVSGVGKSTLYHSLLKEKKFWTIQEFIRFNRKTEANYLTDDSSFYQKLAKIQWEYIQNLTILETDKLRMAHWNYKTINEDILIANSNKNSIVVSDEGILHNFQDSLLKMNEENQEKFQFFLKNRAIIYCYSTPEKIVNQIIDRSEKTGRTVSHHKGKSIEELYDIVKRDLEEKEEFLEIMFNMGIPILRINTQDSLELNSKKINKFIEELSN